MSHEWELTWERFGFGAGIGADRVIAPTLNEAMTIWQIDQNTAAESEPNANHVIPLRIIKVRWKRSVDRDPTKYQLPCVDLERSER